MTGKIQSGAAATTAWMDRFFASYYSHRPVNATFIGVHDFDHLLPDYSEHGTGDALADMQGLLGHAPFPEGESLSPAQEIDRRLAEGFLKIQLWEFRSNHFHRGNPSLYTGEAVFGIMSLLLTEFAPAQQRMEAATERLLAIPTLLAQGTENLGRAPREWTERAIRECDGALAFLTGGIERLSAGFEAGRTSRIVAGFRAAAGQAAEAVSDFQRYLRSELLRNPSQGYACGEEALSLYLREGHFLKEDADEIVTYAESELAEVEARLREHRSFNLESLSGLANLHPSADGYYARYQEVWDSVRALAEEKALLTWPEFPIRYVSQPPWAREAAPHLYFLFYRSPAAFHRPAVHDYLVTPIDESLPSSESEALLRANNDSVIKLNHVIHHGGIGHHVQNWHAFRSPSRIGQVAAVDCASRIAMFCGGTMAEGWACYATDLMGEAGALTPLEEYAELRGRARMCARTVVDIRLHQGRMTLEQAADYYQQRAGMGRDAAVGEAVKNSMFPGAAVIYLLGSDGIHRLRREMAAKRGAGFQLRSFHDELLSYGSIPVTLIGEQMKRNTEKPRPC